jgi:N-acetylglucosamine-6-phosphate deacetylase
MPKKKKSTKRKPSNKKLTKRQTDALKKHSQHHTKKHMAEMRRSMKGGASFTTAHRNAMRKVGK